MNCAQCKAKLDNGLANHIIDYNGHIIIVKNVPALMCHQCGEYFIEHEESLKLEVIVADAKQSQAEVTIINFQDRAA